jgi:tRNA U54 and U55 pseudouridine synthase Pus10
MSKNIINFLTEQQLDAPCQAVTITIFGSYTKRGEQRKDVYEDQYSAEVEVPKNFNTGHIKLAANRYVRNELRGIRARTFILNTKFKPKAVKEPRQVRDFFSAQGLIDNESLRRDYEAARGRQMAVAAHGREAPMPSPDFGVAYDTSQYDENGLPAFNDSVSFSARD